MTRTVMVAGKNSSSGRALSALVDDLQAGGRYTFDRSEAIDALRVDLLSLKRAMMRLGAKKRIVAPRRGFYVIVPLEYRATGAPPPSWFIDDLMRYLGRPYYVGFSRRRRSTALDTSSRRSSRS